MKSAVKLKKIRIAPFSELETYKAPAVHQVSELDTLVATAITLEEIRAAPVRTRYTLLWQIARFSVVGICNTGIDIAIFNVLIFLHPATNANLLLLFNSIAFVLGAVNSFLLNKFWTFRRKRAIKGSEVWRFSVINALGILCNDAIVWSVASLLHSIMTNSLLWANSAKFCAVLGTSFITYFGMRLWVFAEKHY